MVPYNLWISASGGELSIRLAFVQKLFDVHLDLAIWTFGNIFFWDVDYLRSLTFGTFDLHGFTFVSHGWLLLLLELLSQSAGENKEETAWGLRIADLSFPQFLPSESLPHLICRHTLNYNAFGPGCTTRFY